MFKNIFSRKRAISKNFSLWLFFILTGLSLITLHLTPKVIGQSDEQINAIKKQNPNDQNCSGCAAHLEQSIYTPLTDLPEAEGSQIVFNSRAAHPIDVTPVFYTEDGTSITGKPVSINSTEIRYVDLKTLIVP